MKWQEGFTYRGGTENWYFARALRRRGLDVEAHIQFPKDRNIVAALAGPQVEGVLCKQISPGQRSARR